MDDATLDLAWAAAWKDFLANKVQHAERRAAPFLISLPTVLKEAEQGSSSHEAALADRLVTLADLAHIAGAARGCRATLEMAIAAYDAHLARAPLNSGARRMRAETLMRCQQYAAAFEGFNGVYQRSLCDDDGAPRTTDEVAPFQLIHDAECVEHAVRQGADASHLRTAEGWRELAEALIRSASTDPNADHADDAAKLRRHKVASMTAAQCTLLGSHGQPLPLPPSSVGTGAEVGHVTTALNPDIDWAAASRAYISERVVVIDDLLEPQALAAIQAYARHGAHFRTLRNGYLGAFPGDGTTHPLILALVRELTTAAPAIFSSHALALWWIFKYDETNPAGIGIHADPAAVNINLWLTDDQACLEGGGLTIYSHVPALEQPTQAVNHEFASSKAEAAFRDELSAGGKVCTIPYRCNRAAIFVSDQYHESLPFRFASGYENRRANLTLLFGDRWSPLERGARDVEGAMRTAETSPAAGSEAGGGIGAGAGGGHVVSEPGAGSNDGWDVFG